MKAAELRLGGRIGSEHLDMNGAPEICKCVAYLTALNGVDSLLWLWPRRSAAYCHGLGSSKASTKLEHLEHAAHETLKAHLFVTPF